MIEALTARGSDSDIRCLYQMMADGTGDGLYFPPNQGGAGDCRVCRPDPVHNPTCSRYHPVRLSEFSRPIGEPSPFIDDA